MGMYDNVHCEMELPEGARRVQEWQTKSFDAPMLGHYRIKADGLLFLDKWHVETKEGAPPRPHPGDRAVFDWHDQWVVRVNDPSEELPFTGAIEFYGNDPDDTWWEFIALFDEGRCIKLKQVEPA